MSNATAFAINWVEHGLVPDPVIRGGIRRLLKQRLDEMAAHDLEEAARRKRDFVAMMDASEIAPLPEKANEQHYEIPDAFFGEVLGPRRKYSCCFWDEQTRDIVEAENASLALTCERASITDGMSILELGCGWGSLTLWMAEHFPNIEITAVSNAHSQRHYIESQCRERGIGNVRVITADMNDFQAPGRYDRVVSLEMFEHMRNYRALFARVASWLKDDGRFFMHIFCHRDVPYEFVERGPSDWMSKYFFSGGIMPCDDLPLQFQDDLRIENHWRLNGRHYEQTLNAWLALMDQRKASVMPILRRTYGEAEASIWWMRWRIFFMACAELFGYEGGSQWYVGHYLFRKPAAS